MRYLDPKNDLVFKKVFGQHAHILTSFLNALLPLDPDQVITSIEYLPAEMVPEIPLVKNSIVDVRCYDNKGRQFIVEMQMLWTDSFTSRVLFNASKAYVRQLEKGTEYKGLQPVYALSLVNEIFEKDFPEFYHHYRIVHVGDSTKTIDGLQLIFVELPKFDVKTIALKKLTILWLRFLSEIENGKEMKDQDLLNELANVPEIAEALELTKESAYTKAELEAYDKYWDQIRTERTLIVDAETRGLEQGREQGREEGEQIGILKGEQIGIQKKEIEVVLKSHDSGLSISLIASITGVGEKEVTKILKDHEKID